MYVSLKIAGIPVDTIGRLHAIVKSDACMTVKSYSKAGYITSIGKLPCVRIRKSMLDEEKGTYTVTVEIEAMQTAKSSPTKEDCPGRFFPQDLLIFTHLLNTQPIP